MNRCLAAFFALLFASVAVSSACFAGPGDPPTRLVRYDDLDLSTAEGVKALHRRIEHATNQVCLDASGPSPAAVVDLRCKADARRSARLPAEQAIEQHRPRTPPAEMDAGIPAREPADGARS